MMGDFAATKEGTNASWKIAPILESRQIDPLHVIEE